MIEPVFAIPSHDRSEIQTTLEYLTELRVPKSRIFMCVWDTELGDYEKWKPYVNDIFTTDIHNLPAGRNVLLDLIHNPYVVIVDDDLKELSYLKNGKLEPIGDPKLFANFVSHGFASCIKTGSKLWGLYPVHNHFFMKNKTSNWALIIGTWLGIVDEGMRFDPKYTVKEDIDFSCRQLKEYGSVVRFDNVAPNAKHYSKGGCEKQWSLNGTCFKMLMREHSDILRANTKRENEVLLIKRGKTNV